MARVRVYGKRKGKGHKKAKQRAAKESLMLAETKLRSTAISKYLDMIPARFYLGMDNEHVGETAPGYDPAKAKSTSQIVATAAVAERVKAEAAAKERAANAPASALPQSERSAAAQGNLSKTQKRKAQRLGTHTKDGEKKPPAIDPKNRRELQEKLHRRIAEMKEEKRMAQSERDRGNMALRAAGPAVPDASKPAKATKKAGQSAQVKDEAEVGRLSFEANTASLPFKAQVLKQRGGKAKRIQEDMRKNEIEQRKVKKAESAGLGEEVRRDIAMQKALKRARGEEVHDDAARLRKAQRRLDLQKKKSTKKWKKRTEQIKEQAETQQQKRKENLSKTRGKRQEAAVERATFKQENVAASVAQ